jgi:hypothetical protein
MGGRRGISESSLAPLTASWGFDFGICKATFHFLQPAQARQASMSLDKRNGSVCKDFGSIPRVIWKHYWRVKVLLQA